MNIKSKIEKANRPKFRVSKCRRGCGYLEAGAAPKAGAPKGLAPGAEAPKGLAPGAGVPKGLALGAGVPKAGAAPNPVGAGNAEAPWGGGRQMR